jgi:hypothetical protein
MAHPVTHENLSFGVLGRYRYRNRYRYRFLHSL